MIPGSGFTGKSLQVMEGGAAFNDGRISVGDRQVVVKNRQANFNISYFSRTDEQTLIFSIFQAGRSQEPAHWRLLLGQLHSRGERAGDYTNTKTTETFVPNHNMLVPKPS